MKRAFGGARRKIGLMENGHEQRSEPNDQKADWSSRGNCGKHHILGMRHGRSCVSAASAQANRGRDERHHCRPKEYDIDCLSCSYHVRRAMKRAKDTPDTATLPNNINCSPPWMNYLRQLVAASTGVDPDTLEPEFIRVGISFANVKFKIKDQREISDAS